ncbi:MAG: type II toxin-antitoxin system RelE/ParE family toxin [Bacteroidetes bacterium]|nr:MAG: type II toxin-antitoxin system RelE/ParE family toxin [Bacteroidota bacterium]
MKIIWSNQAKFSYEEIIDFILEQWPTDIALDFENKTNNLLDKLKKNIKLCPNSKKKQLRKCVIHKNTSLIYKIVKPNIELITFIDNRSEHQY